MSVLRGIITLVVCATVPALLTMLLTSLTGRVIWWLVVAVSLVMLVYGVVVAVLGSYDLSRLRGWLELLVDTTWSLPNTVFGAVTGLWLYLFFGSPSKNNSQGRGWVSFTPRGSSGFGHNVLQTLGTINIGGAGQHERMHLAQARGFGPLYLPLFALFYVVTFLIQGVFTLVFGLLLTAIKQRQTPYLRPPASSAVNGYFGWIYYATPFEVWAYASGNP